MYSIFKTGIDGETSKIKNLRQAERYLPGQHLHRARRLQAKPAWTTKLLGEDVKGRYADLKQASADRCRPRLWEPSSKLRKSSSITRSTTSSCGICSR